jgi:hypothetical protein
MMDESQYALASSSGATAGRRWPTSISRTSLEDRSAAHLLTSDEAWRIVTNIGKLPQGLLQKPRPLSTHFRYDLNLRTFGRTALAGVMGQHRDVYSITLSARANNASGTMTPSALAVLRLITSSNFVGCWTGMSATLMPRKSWTSWRA